MKTVKAIVKGRVQGVWYRGSTQEQAQRIGLSGYVKNLPNGDVEFVATGSEQQLQQLIEWAWQGPRLAEVNEIITTEMNHIESGTFRIEY